MFKIITVQTDFANIWGIESYLFYVFLTICNTHIVLLNTQISALPCFCEAKKLLVVHLCYDASDFDSVLSRAKLPISRCIVR